MLAVGGLPLPMGPAARTPVWTYALATTLTSWDRRSVLVEARLVAPQSLARVSGSVGAQESTERIAPWALPPTAQQLDDAAPTWDATAAGDLMPNTIWDTHSKAQKCWKESAASYKSMQCCRLQARTRQQFPPPPNPGRQTACRDRARQAPQSNRCSLAEDQKNSRPRALRRTHPESQSDQVCAHQLRGLDRGFGRLET